VKSKERVKRAINRKGVDRLPIRHQAVPEINKQLCSYFKFSTIEELYQKIGHDFRFIEPEYCGPELEEYPDGSFEGIWGERYKYESFGGGVYKESIFRPFADIKSIEELKNYPFPQADWFDCSGIKKKCEQYNDYAIIVGGDDIFDFLNGLGFSRGVEQVLLDIALKSDVFLYLVEKRFEFLYEKLKCILKEGQGYIDIVQLGEDLGTQEGLMIGVDTFKKLFAEKYQSIINLIHKFGAKAMLHSCGSIRQMIPTLINLGLDILDVIQVNARDMNIGELKEEFGKDLVFSGSMCVQSILPHGTKKEVEDEVRLRQDLFMEGGMFIGPTHNIQVGTPIDNILAMYETVLGVNLI